MAKVKFTPITIRQAELATDDSRLYVLNRANPAGNINFNVTDSAGQRIVITVPQSSCPVDLSNFSEKTPVLRNPDFRRLVAKNAIVLINNDEAEAFVTKDPRGIAESKRIYGVIEEGNDLELGIAEIHAPDNASTLAERMGVEATNPFIQSIVLRSKEEDVADLISEVDSKLHTLNIADVEYLAKHAHNADLKAWASEQLEDMRS